MGTGGCLFKELGFVQGNAYLHDFNSAGKMATERNSKETEQKGLTMGKEQLVMHNGFRVSHCYVM